MATCHVLSGPGITFNSSVKSETWAGRLYYTDVWGLLGYVSGNVKCSITQVVGVEDLELFQAK